MPDLTTPALTPDYTDSGEGDGSSSPASETATKSRRPTAFYPHMNSSNKPLKPFSRSAAKRQSVMTLGSIEHLQHYFTKTGIVAKTIPSKRLNSQLVPAIGGLASLKTSKPSLGSIMDFELPPSPVVPEIRQPVFPPHVKTHETDTEALLLVVAQDLTGVTHAWSIYTRDAPLNPNHPTPTSCMVDVLDILKTTTHAIRSVRNYVIALPDDSAGTLRTHYRNKVAANVPVPKRNPTQPKSQLDPLSLIRKSALEVLAALRELEERSRVPLSDEAYDAQSDRASSQDLHPHSRGVSPAVMSDDELDLPHVDPDMSISFVHVQGRKETIPVWEDEYDNLSEEEREKREHWDDRLVLGGGWLYKQDFTLAALGKEQDVVERYVDLVDDVLFGGTKDGKRGWEREAEKNTKKTREGGGQNRRVSTGDVFTYRFPSEAPRSGRRVVSTSGVLDSMRSMSLSEELEDMEILSEAGSIDEDDLPGWAKRSLFADDPVGRAHALLIALLPESLRSLIPSTSDKSAFYSALTSGQCLCTAYNTGVRRSRKPWGFISVGSIHDVASLEQSADGADGDEKGKVGWTFRRIDNLRLWAGALKLRYLLPLVVPSTLGRPDHIPRTSSPARTQSRGASPARSPSGHTTFSLAPADAPPSPTPVKIRSATAESPLMFDPRLVARKDHGWETMLETVVLRWVKAVVDETRSESLR
ncbi:hypothetical protein JVT61DRAFT_8772 [Boletus reticuloceps]|uniref:Uncharacterized protein n=1 Tax=Boletus reticuloceps TaxID=495285 RepID=A0A8I2YH71_9AGAM|nr:hypothetical protein JVT61DRAFT_8772 [Boletus reticuloceps]